MRHSKSRDLQCSSLSNLHRYHARDLFSSHAKRTGTTKQKVVETKCKSYQPRSCPVTPYSTPRPKYEKTSKKEKIISSKSNEIADQLKWLRKVANQQYQPPTTYSTFSRPSSRYSKYSVNKSVQNHFNSVRNKKYKRPFSSITYRSSQKSSESQPITRPQTAKIMLPNKMLTSTSHRNLHRYNSNRDDLNIDDDNNNDFTLSGWSLKDKGQRNFVFDHPNNSITQTPTQEMENKNTNPNNTEHGENSKLENNDKSEQETKPKREKPKMDALDINNIDSQNDNFKQWRIPKTTTLNRDSSIRSIEIVSDDDDNDNSMNNINNTSRYLTSIEREDFTTRSVLQNTQYTDHLFTHRPKSVPCGGMKFSDFEKLKIDLSKSGITVHRSAIENGLSTPHPTFNSHSLPNNEINEIIKKKTNKTVQPKYKYPFPIPGELLISMKSHGLEPKYAGGSGGGGKKKGKKGKKGKKSKGKKKKKK